MYTKGFFRLRQHDTFLFAGRFLPDRAKKQHIEGQKSSVCVRPILSRAMQHSDIVVFATAL